MKNIHGRVKNSMKATAVPASSLHCSIMRGLVLINDNTITWKGMLKIASRSQSLKAPSWGSILNENKNVESAQIIAKDLKVSSLLEESLSPCLSKTAIIKRKILKTETSVISFIMFNKC